MVAQNLERRDVKVLAVDDVNLRKGDASTACPVFIDGETHRFLVMVEGARQDVTEAVMAQFPTVDIVIRDRGSAYAAAARARGKLQVADGFHLIDNLHEAIQEALSHTLGPDVFLREGEGWVQPDELEETGAERPQAMTLSEPDREQRIRLARLTARQARKYRTTLNLLELSDRGLSTFRDKRGKSCKKSRFFSPMLRSPGWDDGATENHENLVVLASDAPHDQASSRPPVAPS